MDQLSANMVPLNVAGDISEFALIQLELEKLFGIQPEGESKKDDTCTPGISEGSSASTESTNLPT